MPGAPLPLPYECISALDDAIGKYHGASFGKLQENFGKYHDASFGKLQENFGKWILTVNQDYECHSGLM